MYINVYNTLDRHPYFKNEYCDKFSNGNRTFKKITKKSGKGLRDPYHVRERILRTWCGSDVYYCFFFSFKFYGARDVWLVGCMFVSIWARVLIVMRLLDIWDEYNNRYYFQRVTSLFMVTRFCLQGYWSWQFSLV